MTLQIYNTLSAQKEDFLPLAPPKVRMYVCGITPYDETHLGHGRAYVTFDVIRRYLEYRGFQVEHIQNVTDIDDKIINQTKILNSNDQMEKCREVSEKYISSYFEVMDALNVKRATHYPKATENVPQMIEFIKGLIDKGFAYVVDGNVFFEVEKFADYGKLSKRKKKDLQAGARLEIDQRKKNPLDFALWKAAKEGEPFWETPWGQGRPGWHIECSAMSSRYLGQQFDIHGGGLDLIFPHHENEIAQSEAYSGKKPWVKYWVHNGFVNIKEQKMSKSWGNFFTLKDILDKFDPMVVRYFFLSSHYRSPINFSDAQLQDAKEAYGRLAKTRSDLDFLISKVGGPQDEVEVAETRDELAIYRERFEKALDDDFNTAAGLAAIFELIGQINQDIKEEKIDCQSLREDRGMLVRLCEVIGLRIKGLRIKNEEDLEDLVKERETARTNKDFKRSDEIRDQLWGRGIILEDTPQGTRWSAK